VAQQLVREHHRLMVRSRGGADVEREIIDAPVVGHTVSTVGARSRHIQCETSPRERPVLGPVLVDRQRLYQAWESPQCGHATEVRTGAWKTKPQPQL
jgi:hypothetical protein